MNAVRIRRLACAAGLALLSAAACAPAAAQDGVAIPRQGSFPRFRAGQYDPEDLALAWTAGGELIVGHTELFTSGDVTDRSCDGTGFYAVPVAGGAARPLAEGGPVCIAFDEGAAVSPDGRWAVFSEWMPDRQTGVMRLDFATGRMDTLPTGCGAYLGQPAVSADGTRIAVLGFCGGRDEDYGVYVMSADGGGLRLAAAGAKDVADRYPPAWSPDGRRIAFTRGGRVMVAAADGGGGRAVARGAMPAWSPDGAWIAFVDREPGERHAQALFVMRADGSGRRLVFRNEVRTTYFRGFGNIREGELLPPLVWSPDGRWIAFSRRFGAGTSIWRVEVRSGRPEPVTRPGR